LCSNDNNNGSNVYIKRQRTNKDGPNCVGIITTTTSFSDKERSSNSSSLLDSSLSTESVPFAIPVTRHSAVRTVTLNLSSRLNPSVRTPRPFSPGSPRSPASPPGTPVTTAPKTGIEPENIDEKGTTIPVPEPEETPKNAESECVGIKRDSSGKMVTSTTKATIKLLYAEDSEACRNIIKKFARCVGIVCETVSDGLECVKKISENPQEFSLILMDIIMPVMDGITAADQIRTSGFKIPIVALSGVPTSDMEQRCTTVGMNGFVHKPMTVSKLKNLIREQQISK